MLAIVVGSLYATGIYLMLGRSLFRLVVGLVLLSHGANLLIFTTGGLVRGHPPIIPATAEKSPKKEEGVPKPKDSFLSRAESSDATSPAPEEISSSNIFPSSRFADPLPQALILTSIVISFGVLAFALVLFHRTYQVIGSDDPDKLRGPVA